MWEYDPFIDDQLAFMHIHLANNRGFWQRLRYGLAYAFGRKSRFGAFDEIILNPKDADKLQRVVNHLKNIEKQREKKVKRTDG
jgi:hypothetical protein